MTMHREHADTATTAAVAAGALLRRAAGALGEWSLRRKGRAELARLSPYQLKDVGLTPGQASFEAAKPFWRA